ncbi:response regulator [Rufibacter hautae]|uniref:Response regulator n=1 Tax=Rufibacter hautae TaxID=2595005 RepID=A0A5B6TFE2_9BACT|nr:response regulator [Rufibacter hautae]KAA3437942.1 response regulator [Rufibacter hautae]
MKKLKNVLLVDDDEITLFLKSMLLASEGSAEEILMASNGQEAQRILEERCSTAKVCSCDLDVILLDINMPVMTGFEFLEEYGQMDLACDPKLVILSSSNHPLDQAQAGKFALAGMLTKPLNVQDLTDLLLQNSEPENELLKQKPSSDRNPH